MATRMAKHIKVTNRRNESLLLEIDGEEFPYFTADGYSTQVNRTSLGSITLTIVAESLEIIDDRFVADAAEPHTMSHEAQSDMHGEIAVEVSERPLTESVRSY